MNISGKNFVLSNVVPQNILRIQYEMSFFDHESLERVKSNDMTLTTLVMRVLTDDEAQLLGAGLLGNTFVCHLNLNYSILSSDRIKYVLSHLPMNINTLTLCNCQISPTDARDLAHSLMNSSISYLDLRHNPIGDDGAESLSLILREKRCKTLKSLMLGYCDIGDDGVLSIMDGIQGYKTNFGGLEELDLRGNTIGFQGTLAISRVLSSLSFHKSSVSLMVLDLRDNNIRDEGTELIAEALAKPDHPLIYLNLSGNNISDQGARYLANALTWNDSIQRLVLSRNAIEDNGAEDLLDALEYNDTLYYLDLSQNTINRRVRVEISDILEANRLGERIKLERQPSNDDSHCSTRSFEGGSISGLFVTITNTILCRAAT
jgi:Ran GTPase-activating protein (RanGAP) involved in mRNA processing and transport